VSRLTLLRVAFFCTREEQLPWAHRKTYQIRKKILAQPA
jgi:hypothetical protein